MNEQKKVRPVNLDLTKFRFPVMAIVSIGHRISGVLLFLCLPILFYLLSRSLHSADSFAATASLLQHPMIKIAIWVILCSTLFHLIAGLRHLSLDMGFGESLAASRVSAYAVFVVAGVTFIILGAWLW